MDVLSVLKMFAAHLDNVRRTLMAFYFADMRHLCLQISSPLLL